MVKEICLVINNTGRDIRIDEFWEKYLPNFNSTEVSHLRKGEIIVRNGYTNIKPSQFIERCQTWQLSNNADLYKWVSLSDDSENGVVLSKEDIDANTGFVIMCMGRTNQLVKEPVSKEESKSSGKRKESEKELKDRLISIVENRNDASAHQLPSGEGEHFGQGEQKNASAALSLENKGENADPSQEGKGENLRQGKRNALLPSAFSYGGKLRCKLYLSVTGLRNLALPERKGENIWPGCKGLLSCQSTVDSKLIFL